MIKIENGEIAMQKTRGKRLIRQKTCGIPRAFAHTRPAVVPRARRSA
jgi:hypothetical protein